MADGPDSATAFFCLRVALAFTYLMHCQFTCFYCFSYRMNHINRHNQYSSKTRKVPYRYRMSATAQHSYSRGSDCDMNRTQALPRGRSPPTSPTREPSPRPPEAPPLPPLFVVSTLRKAWRAPLPQRRRSSRVGRGHRPGYSPLRQTPHRFDESCRCLRGRGTLSAFLERAVVRS